MSMPEDSGQQGTVCGDTSNSFRLKFRMKYGKMLDMFGPESGNPLQVFERALTLELHLMKINQAMIHKADSIQRWGMGVNGVELRFSSLFV